MTLTAEVWTGIGIAGAAAAGAVGRHFAPMAWKSRNGNGNGKGMTEHDHELICAAKLAPISATLVEQGKSFDRLREQVERLIELR